MSQRDEAMKLIEQLSSEDETLREQARLELQKMGKDAIPYLNMARGQRNRFSYVEVFRMLIRIGDDMHAESGGTISKGLVETIQFGSKRNVSSIPEEVNDICAQALTRWGMEVPQPKKEDVHRCHKCNRASPETTVKICFLPACRKPVCKDHAFIIEGGFSGTWFCSDEHKQQALKNPSMLM